MCDYRAIRASYDEDCIVVYQAYNKDIADAAVREQKLSASPSYRLTRMTWVKPSFSWMMYRCGYSYKDANQERVLALRIKHKDFYTILRQACLAAKSHTAGQTVVVQWDPERSPRLGKMEYRSLQVGIPPSLQRRWIDEWIESIEDVTETARGLKEKLDKDADVGLDELVKLGFMPSERVYEVPSDIHERLEMS